MLEEQFARVAFPLRSTDYDTNVTMTLLTNQYFLEICRWAFGPMTLASGALNQNSTRDGGVYWMDEANHDPEGKLAKQVMDFFKPGSNFHAIMEHVSAPTSSFFNTVKKGLVGESRKGPIRGATSIESNNIKGTSAVGSSEGGNNPFLKRFDIPLATLCSWSLQIVQENATSDPTVASRDRVPPALLVPFWYPPMVVREDPVTRQVHNSLPCSMLSYFLLRLMLFISMRCRFNDRDVLLEELNGRSASWSQKAEAWLAAKMKDPFLKQSKSFSFALRLLGAYVEFYGKSSTISRVMDKRSLDDIPWDISTTTLMLLVYGPQMVWLRTVPSPTSELQRSRIPDPEGCASISVLVPYLIDLVKRIGKDALPHAVARMSIAATTSTNVAQTSAVGLHTTSEDILQLSNAFLRHILIVLRLASMSYPTLTNVKPMHYENLLQLWQLITDATIGAPQNVPSTLSSSHDANRRDTFVVQRYEAFTFLLGDMLGMLHNSDLLNTVQRSGAEVLERAVVALTDEQNIRILRDISKHLRDAGSNALTGGGPGGAQGQQRLPPLIQLVRQHLLLSWTRSDGQTVVSDFFGPELTHQVSLAVMAIWRRTDAQLIEMQRARQGERHLEASPSTRLESLVGAINTVFKGDRADSKARVGVSPEVADVLNRCVAHLLRLFPEASQSASKLREEYVSSSQQGPKTHPRSSASFIAEIPSMLPPVRYSNAMTADARKLFLEGTLQHCPLSSSVNLHFAVGNEPLTKTLPKSDEFPLLVALSMFVDEWIEFFQTLAYWKMVPRCHRGHLLWLSCSGGKRCNQHHSTEGVWECHTCGVRFCDSKCKAPPMKLGKPLRAFPSSPTAVTGLAVCTQCHLVLPQGSVAYCAADGSNSDIGADSSVYCARCASRPFEPLSTRFLASYSVAWAGASILLLIAFIWYVLWG